MVISKLPISIGKELHGAMIVVATEESSLVGQSVELYLGDIIVAIKPFNESGVAQFEDIQVAGEYKIKVDSFEEIVTVTNEDIYSKNMIEVDIISAIELVLGQTYQMAGYNWTCAEEKDGYYVLQSQGITGGYWPGYVMSKFGGTANSYYSSNIDGQDISDYNNTMKTLYSNIKAAEKSGTVYGSGLFLVSNSKAGTTTHGAQGSGHYCSALKTAATNHSSFGTVSPVSWLGTVYGGNYAWFVNSNGNVVNSFYSSNYQNVSFVIAPAFNLDKTKASLDGNTILIR